MLDNLQLLFVWAPIINLQVILDGIFVGAVFALSAYGLALVWGVMNIKNLAQGDFVIMGGYLALSLHYLGIPLPLILIIVVVLMFVFGWGIYILIIRRIIDQDMFVSLLATFGLSLLLQQVLNLFYGPEVQTIDMKMGAYDAFDYMVSIPYSKVLSLILAAIITICVVIFMKRSRMGQAIRATAQDPRAARVLGIDTDRVYAFTFAFNAALCGAAGVLVSIIWVIQPFYGITYSVRSFAIVTAAGLGNLPGVALSGMGLGVFEEFADYILGTEFRIGSVFMLLVLILVYRRFKLSRKREYLK